MRSGREMVTHGFEPVYDQRSRVLVLGTMPSPRSREEGFYYGHPRNRFWRVMADLLEEPLPVSPEEKRAMMLRRRIALWDVLRSCEICGADDGSIRNPVANDLTSIFCTARIQAVFTTGSKAAALYRNYCEAAAGMAAIPLPSTSPANCRTGLEELKMQYGIILGYLT